MLLTILRPTLGRIGLISVSATLILVGCSKPSTEVQGGQDGGGGNTQQSSTIEVRAAIELAFTVATQPKIGSNLFYAFASTLSDESYADIQEVRRKVFDPSNTGIYEVGKDLEDYSEKVEKFDRDSKNRPAFLQEKLLLSSRRIVGKGGCEGPDNRHVDASVSERKFGAVICFSVESLRRLPNDVLLREVFSLLLHEATHLGGFGESEAHHLQGLFSSYLESRLSTYSTNKLRENWRSGARRAESEAKLNSELGYEELSGYSARAIAENLNLVSSVIDPALVDHSLKPKRPELYSEIIQKRDEIVNQLDRMYSLRRQFNNTNGHLEEDERSPKIECNPLLLPPDEFRKYVWKKTYHFYELVQLFLDGQVSDREASNDFNRFEENERYEKALTSEAASSRKCEGIVPEVPNESQNSGRIMNQPMMNEPYP